MVATSAGGISTIAITMVAAVDSEERHYFWVYGREKSTAPRRVCMDRGQLTIRRIAVDLCGMANEGRVNVRVLQEATTRLGVLVISRTTPNEGGEEEASEWLPGAYGSIVVTGCHRVDDAFVFYEVPEEAALAVVTKLSDFLNE